MYYLRDENGTLKAKLSSIVAGVIIDGDPKGCWVKKYFVNGKTANAFVIHTEGITLGKANTVGLELILWDGDYLTKGWN